METGIPVDSLDVRILHLSSAYYRNWRIEDFEDNTTHKLIDNGHAFYYRSVLRSILICLDSSGNLNLTISRSQKLGLIFVSVNHFFKIL